MSLLSPPPPLEACILTNRAGRLDWLHLLNDGRNDPTLMLHGRREAEHTGCGLDML